MTEFTVTAGKHFAFGAMLRLEAAGLRLDFTRDEADTVSRALKAVLDGRSQETEIYLSPIASDGAFSASVTAEGVTLAGAGAFDWASAGRLAKALAA